MLRVAVELDYLEAGAPAMVAASSPLQGVFLLLSGVNRWMQMLGDYVGRIEGQMLPFNVKCRCVWVEGFNPELFAKKLLEHGQRADGIAFVALEHPLVREAVNHLAEKGVHVLTLASDLSSSRRTAYVGLDNRAAGRTAGLMLGRFLGERPGEGRRPAATRAWSSSATRSRPIRAPT